jgi:hypothetical protein
MLPLAATCGQKLKAHEARRFFGDLLVGGRFFKTAVLPSIVERSQF